MRSRTHFVVALAIVLALGAPIFGQALEDVTDEVGLSGMAGCVSGWGDYDGGDWDTAVSELSGGVGGF